MQIVFYLQRLIVYGVPGLPGVHDAVRPVEGASQQGSGTSQWTQPMRERNALAKKKNQRNVEQIIVVSCLLVMTFSGKVPRHSDICVNVSSCEL